MTTMQMEFNKLQESKRHNAEQEDVARREATTKERDISVKEKKLGSEVFANYTKGAENISKTLFGKNGVVNSIANLFSPFK